MKPDVSAPPSGGKVLTEDQAYELLTFLVTSARLCIDEPENYGSFRLIDAASRLLGMLLTNEGALDREFYGQLQKEIDSQKLLILSDEEAYTDFLRHAAREVGRHLKAKSAAGARVQQV
jgi:hypothetical protein